MKKILLTIFFTIPLLAQAQFWTEVAPFPLNSNYYTKNISIVDETTVWVTGLSTENLTTEKWALSLDGGETWTSGNIDIGGSGRIIANIHAVSATTAYVAVYKTSSSTYCGIWITRDSGVTWTRQDASIFNNILDSFTNFVYFWDENSGIAVGDPESDYFEIYTTENGGTNWTRVPEANFPALLEGEYGYVKSYVVNENHIWFGTNKGRIFRSADKGQHWDVSQSPLTDFADTDGYSGYFSFENQNTGLLISKNFDLYKTFDGGQTWNAQTVSGTYRNGALQYVPETADTYFNIGEDQTFFRGSSYSTDSGASWIDLNTADADPVMPLSVEFKNGTVAYCIGYYRSEMANPVSRIFKLTDPMHRLLPSEKFNVKPKISATPNPTHGIVNISGKNIRSVAIFDLSGKKVLTENYSVADQVSLNISKLQNGIYLASISDDLGLSSTIKIIKK